MAQRGLLRFYLAALVPRVRAYAPIVKTSDAPEPRRTGVGEVSGFRLHHPIALQAESTAGLLLRLRSKPVARQPVPGPAYLYLQNITCFSADIRGKNLDSCALPGCDQAYKKSTLPESREDHLDLVCVR